jgi:hypothetical protein
MQIITQILMILVCLVGIPFVVGLGAMTWIALDSGLWWWVLGFGLVTAWSAFMLGVGLVKAATYSPNVRYRID